MAPADPPSFLDHLIHLTPPNSLKEAIAEFEALGFYAINGGQHADGETANALIMLQDGVYVELIFFLHDPPPISNRWGRRHVGWIDAACLGTSLRMDQIVNDNYNKKFRKIVNPGEPKIVELYNPPKEGGRKTADDEPRDLKWLVTISNEMFAAGELPFFCDDLTPRYWRVPTNPTNSSHSNKVLGIAELVYVAPAEPERRFQQFKEQISGAFNRPAESIADGSYKWELRVPTPVKKGNKILTASVSLRLADQQEEDQKKRGMGLYEVAFWADYEVSDINDVKRVSTKWGKMRILPLNYADLSGKAT